MPNDNKKMPAKAASHRASTLEDVQAGSATRRKKAARFVDIAAEAGVSISTVNRVLNNLGGVSDKASARVGAAVRSLGVPRILPASTHGVIHIDVLLPRHLTPIFARIDAALERAIQMIDPRVQIHRIRLPWQNQRAYVRAILRPPYRRSGLLIMAPNADLVRDAIKQAMLAGEPVAIMMNDFADLPAHHFAGVDQYSAGRTAGYWIARLARDPGRVMIIRGLPDNAAVEARINGAVDGLKRFGRGLEVECPITASSDDPDICFQLVSAALKKGPLIGLYDTGYGSPGIDAALKKYKTDHKTLWIGHEMLDEHRGFLDDGSMDLLIDQNPDGQVLSGLQYLLHANGILKDAPPSSVVDFSVVSLTNVPERPYLG